MMKARYLTFAVLVVQPVSGTAQIPVPSSAWEVSAGVQVPLADLRSDSDFDVRRSNAIGFGLAGHFHADRPLLWRLSGSVALSEIRIREERQHGPFPAGKHVSSRTEYTFAVDAARRILNSVPRSGGIELRAYLGTGLRWINRSDDVCILIASACLLASEYPERLPDPVGRLGILGSLHRPSLTTRVDVGYRLSNAWSVPQHDIVMQVGFSFYVANQ